MDYAAVYSTQEVGVTRVWFSRINGCGTGLLDSSGSVMKNFILKLISTYRCADVTLKLKLCTDQLSQVSELLTQIDLPEDGAPITLEWMKLRQDEIGIERSRIFSEKRADSNKLTKHKEMVLSELEKLRVLNRQHRKLMLEVWSHLTSLARVSDKGWYTE